MILATLESRFAAHPERHLGLAWSDVRARLEAAPEKMRSLAEMERTGGEPDVVGTDGIVFFDCSAESPAGRRSLCYDRSGWESRKEHRPEGSAVDLASEMGIELLTEAEYAALQALGEFDVKTSSWLATPPEVRSRGGALFGDRRFGRAFTYHNGAGSYYGSRGFRGSLRI